MKIQKYISFIVILLLISILNSVYNKYNSTCREFFIEDEVQKDDAVLTNIVAWKNRVSTLLCETESFIENSIGFNQINDFSKESVDMNYKLDTIEKVGINGTNDFKNSIVFDSIVVNENNETCQVPIWKPDVVEDKDSIVVYISALVKEFNSGVLTLEEEKMKLVEYIKQFNRFFKQNMSEIFIPQCDRMVGEDRTKFCTPQTIVETTESVEKFEEQTTKKTNTKLIEDSKKGLLIVDEKRKEMDKMICNYIKMYKKIENIREVIIMYVNKLNNIWSNNDIENTKIRLNYANSQVTAESAS